MEYRVHFIDDAALPEEVEWTFATQAGRTVLFVKESAVDCKTGECPALTRAWEVWESEGHHEPPRPRRRIRTEVGYIRTAAAVLLAGYGITAMKVGSVVL